MKTKVYFPLGLIVEMSMIDFIILGKQNGKEFWIKRYLMNSIKAIEIILGKSCKMYEYVYQLFFFL